MPRPDFTPDEQYLVNYAKSPTARRNAGAFTWGYVMGGIALGCCGAYYKSVELMVVAFALVIGFRIYEERYQRRWDPVFRSLIAKYEAALVDPAKSQRVDDAQAGSQHEHGGKTESPPDSSGPGRLAK